MITQTKTNSWRLYRAGLINFWYYDQEEFEFAEGRMLLRGSNGSGKSVTMQSFIPLLLDGNRSPERLDPFGSKSRKLDNYMLHDQDERDERVGYLYLSFKQTDVDLYQTIGMGIRARKHMPLETWYFQLNNNKRINDNFSLYRNENKTNVLTKGELKQAIGEDGQVFDTQREYTEVVNRILFGFDSVDEYKELINLLIQLRSPKLSKDFKPTVINEILTQSLQPLTDDDLRPLSEAIENMDGIETNLAALKTVQTALNRLSQAFVHYNSAVFREETQKLQAKINELNQQFYHLIERSKRIEAGEAELRHLQQALNELETEQQVVVKKIEDLQHHDVVSLKERQERLQQEIDAEKNYHKLKQEQIAKKEAEISRLNNTLRDRQQEQVLLNRQLNALFIDMDALADELLFDEHEFFKHELQKQWNQSFNFALTNDALKKFKQLLQDTKDALQKTELHQHAYERLLEEQDQLTRERTTLEHSLRAHLDQLNETKAEWQSEFIHWVQNNEVFKLDGPSQDEIYNIVQHAENGYDDLAAVQPKITHLSNEMHQELSAKLVQDEHELAQLNAQINEKQMLYQEWLDKKDPEPIRSKACQNARDYLAMQKIPFTPFYQTLDFQADLSEELMNRLEELLLETKLLDALIIPSAYKDQVLAYQAGQQGNYLFVDYPGQLNNLSRYLVDAISEDHLSGWDKASLEKQLNTIFHGEGQASSAIQIEPAKGQFKLGPLHGTISGEYEAKFIGVSRRERYRLNMLSQIQEELDALQAVAEPLQQQIASLKEASKQLANEVRNFPGFDDLREAFRDYDGVLMLLEQNQDKLKQLEASVTKAKQIYEEYRSKSQQLCRQLSISESMEVVQSFIQASEEYTEMYINLQQKHQQYISQIKQAQNLMDNIADSEFDLTDFIGELTRFENKIKVLEQDLASVIEQLKTSDYDKIRQMLDEALSARRSLPEKINTTREQRARLDQQLINYREEIEKVHQAIQASSQDVVNTYQGYMDEVKLAYAYDEGNWAFQMELDDLWQSYLEMDYAETTDEACAILERLVKRLAKELTNVKENRRYRVHETTVQDSYHSLQQEYILQQNQLTQYGLEMKIYQSQWTPNYSRADIQAKLQGRTVSLFELSDAIAEQVDGNQRLLQKEDRELFEEIITNTIGSKIRAKIHLSEIWVKEMNTLMSQAEDKTSNGFMLSLKWRYKESQQEGELSSRELIHLLKRDAALMTDVDRDKLTLHFRNRIKQAREWLSESNHTYTFHTMLREVLDYRQWFEFQLLFKKAGEKMAELTNNKFFALSGGEKAMAMYVPLFSAVVAKYRGARSDAPRIISLDEAFAGIDELNIREMFRYMIQFKFNFIINSQILWGDYDTVPQMRIYQLLRPQNVKFVTVVPYLWDGSKRICEADPLDEAEEE